MIERRALLGQGAAFAIAASPAGRARAATEFPLADYRRAIVIAGLGGVDDPGSDNPNATVVTPKGAALLKASGLTAVNVTVNQVGNQPDVWERTIANIATLDQTVVDNPELFIKAHGAGDIRRAKAEGRTAFVYGVQDTSLVGTELDRLALLKGLGVRIVQLTY